MQFYERFLELCTATGKKPSAVLIENKLSKSLGTRWKSGYMPTDITLKILAEYFNVSVEYLKGEEKEQTKKSSDSSMSEDEKKLIELFKRVPENQRDLVLAMIETVLKNRRQF